MKENFKIILAGTDDNELAAVKEKLSADFEKAAVIPAKGYGDIDRLLIDECVDLVVYLYEKNGISLENVLYMVSQRKPDMPFIIIANGTIDKFPKAIFTHKRCSIVDKNNTMHLTYAVKRELVESAANDKYMELFEKYQKLGVSSKIQSKNYLSVFNAAPVGMLLVDEKLIIRKVNTETGKIFNKNLLELLNKRIGNAISCINSSEKGMGCGYGAQCQFCHITNIVNKAFRDNEPIYDIEIQQSVEVNGKSKYYWLSMSVIPMNMQGRKYVVVVFDNVTDYINIEQKLMRSRDFYLTLFEEFPALIWRSGLDGKCNYFNKTWLRFTGRSMEQELGDGWCQGVHPEDLGYCMEIYLESFEARRPFEMEYRIQRCDGEYRWIVDMGRPFYDIDGSFAGYIGVCYDVTERRVAEEGLRRYQVLSEKARDIIIFVDTKGMIIEANEAATAAYGYSREELLAKTIYEIRGETKSVKQNIQQAESVGIFFETLHYRKDGTVFPVEVSSQGTEIKGKKVILSIIRDITERKRIERELKKAKEDAETASKAKSEFLANMSHEIRTPLNGVIGMIDLTLLTELTQKQRENIGIAKNCANTLLKVINDVLDFSKIEAGKMNIENIEFDIRQLAERVTKAHSVFAEKKGLKLHCNIDVGIPPILSGDPGKLSQIMNNLLGNAIKFTEQGEIVLEIRRDNNAFPMTIQFSIKDTGIGMTQDEMGRLFRSFSQVDGSITRKYGGTGLGLSISKMLAEMMGGKIWVESRKGEGSTFHFTIAFESGAGGAVAEENTHRLEISKTLNSKNILLIEDDRINQIITRQMLVEKGHSVEIANNGMEGLSMATSKKYDIMLMDIQMPVMDGIEATKLIREYEKTKGEHTPIIALTAYAFHDDKEKFISAGMDEYVSKPIQMNELFDKIEKLSKKDKYEYDTTGHDKDLQCKESVVNLIPESQSYDFDIKSKYVLLREAMDVKNIIMAESIANSIKNIAAENNGTEVKNIAFKLVLAIRRRNLEDAEAWCKELEAKITC